MGYLNGRVGKNILGTEKNMGTEGEEVQNGNVYNSPTD